MRKKKAIFNMLSNLALQIIVILYGFIVPKIIITLYGSSVNGLISSITQFLGYISLLQAGFGPVVISLLYKPLAKKDKKEIQNILSATERFFRKIAAVFIIYIIMMALFYPIFINKEFDYFYTFSLIIIISISTFAEYYFGMTYSLYLQSEQKLYIISSIQIITYILNIFFIVILSRFNISVHIIKLISALIFVLRPILQNIYVRKKYNIDLKAADKDYKIKNKWDGLSQHIAAVIHGNTDITLLTFFCKMSEISVYSVYYMIVSGIKKIVMIFPNSIAAAFGDMLAKNEIDNLNKKFNIYEMVYFIIITIIFSCSIILIVPFVSVYTKNVSDISYIRYMFGYMIVISEYICMIRYPYIDLTYSAGHFKETRNGAWIESLTNIILSIVLVKKYGLVGVTIGTAVAMTIRTCEFLYHTNKYILRRSMWISIRKILLIVVETIIIFFSSKFLPYLEFSNYINWVINACMVAVEAIFITLTLNYILYKNYFKEFLIILKNIIKRSGKNEIVKDS